MRMPFGRYRGRRITDVPTEYLRWLTTLRLRSHLQRAVENELSERETPAYCVAAASVAPPHRPEHESVSGVAEAAQRRGAIVIDFAAARARRLRRLAPAVVSGDCGAAESQQQ